MMKKLIFVLCLLFSVSVQAVDLDYIREWNRQFSLLNNIPDDKRANQSALMSYYKLLVANNRANGGNHFTLPGEVILPTAPPAVPVVPSVPVVAVDPPFNPAQYPQIAPGTMARDMIIKLKRDIDDLYNLR